MVTKGGEETSCQPTVLVTRNPHQEHTLTYLEVAALIATFRTCGKRREAYSITKSIHIMLVWLVLSQWKHHNDNDS